MRELNIEKYKLTPLDIELAHRIRLVRLEKGLSQREVAEQMGITRGAYTHFESGRNKIRHHFLKRIAEIYQRPVSYFLNDDIGMIEREMGLGVNEETQRTIDSWKMKRFLSQKKLPKEFIKDLEESMMYLCELHRVNFDEIW